MKIIGIPYVPLGDMYDALRIEALAHRLSNDAKVVMVYYSALSPGIRRNIDILGWMCYGTEDDIILPGDLVNILNHNYFQARFWDICGNQVPMV